MHIRKHAHRPDAVSTEKSNSNPSRLNVAIRASNELQFNFQRNPFKIAHSLCNRNLWMESKEIGSFSALGILGTVCRYQIAGYPTDSMAKSYLGNWSNLRTKLVIMSTSAHLPVQFVNVVWIMLFPLSVHVIVNVPALRECNPIFQFGHIDETIFVLVDFIHDDSVIKAQTHLATTPKLDQSQRVLWAWIKRVTWHIIANNSACLIADTGRCRNAILQLQFIWFACSF